MNWSGKTSGLLFLQSFNCHLRRNLNKRSNICVYVVGGGEQGRERQTGFKTENQTFWRLGSKTRAEIEITSMDVFKPELYRSLGGKNIMSCCGLSTSCSAGPILEILRLFSTQKFLCFRRTNGLFCWQTDQLPTIMVLLSVLQKCWRRTVFPVW